MAASKGHLELTLLLLERGAEIDAKNKVYMTYTVLWDV
jgi:ankyrin repeat protein